VDSTLDISLLYDSYRNATGAPPFDPAMMTTSSTATRSG
jgi:hypothetical protein